MRTHNIQFHEKIIKFPSIFISGAIGRKSLGLKKRVRINHGNEPSVFELLWFDSMNSISCVATSENVPSDIYARRRFKSACASAQSDQSLQCSSKETLNPRLSEMR